MKFTPLSLLFLVLCIWETNAIKCYTCLGRDLDNCLLGEVNCNHGCMKVVDETHSVIAKGCKGDIRKDLESGNEITLDEVTLPWTTKNDKEKQPEPVKGIAYFCANAEMCNAASSLIPLSLTVFVGMLLITLLHLL